MHQACGVEVFVPGLEGERGAGLLLEKGERFELGDGGGAVGNSESGEEGYYCFWRGERREGAKIIIRVREEEEEGEGGGRRGTSRTWRRRHFVG